MAYSKNVWSQLKGKTVDDFIKALKKDGWREDTDVGATTGSIFTFVKEIGGEMRRVQIHWHPKKTYGPHLLKGLLNDIGWSEQDMRRIKLIK